MPCIHIHIFYTHLAKYQSLHVARHIVFYPSRPKHPSAMFPEMFIKTLNMQRKQPCILFSNQNSESVKHLMYDQNGNRDTAAWTDGQTESVKHLMYDQNGNRDTAGWTDGQTER